MRTRMGILAAGAALLASGPVLRADVLAYPEKGQSAQQQDKDKYDCYQWAKQQTGFDPQAAAGTAAPPPPSQKGGAAGGAAKGAVGGAILGHPGRGAAIGALGGAVRHRGSEKEAQQQQQQAQAQKQSQLAAFDQAQSVCMKGRGYSVK